MLRRKSFGKTNPPSDDASSGARSRHERANANERLLKITLLAVLVAVGASVAAKILVVLIGFVTGISFYGRIDAANASPANSSLGFLVVIVPALGGVLVGLMAFYGSKAIRGHGIPEAMEQILMNQSKIDPLVTLLKPLSSAISIGTGGPFGAEGPIIATGGALGSTIGQMLEISHHERKILLAAGASAGMAAIFGSPIAAIFLAVELLLFEFSPRSIIPVSLASITGAVGHVVAFGSVPMFAMNAPATSASMTAIAVYACVGVIVGGLSILATKAVYSIEDLFEKLPVHWMWWPAIGGLAVGTIGYFAPLTLGVGYENIRGLLTENLPLTILLSLCFLKFLSWAVALGSGTSGGTLAPLFTIGGAAGALIGAAIIRLFPGTGITVPLAALVGMSAMFAGASRAVMTAVIFAFETTGQAAVLLPVLASCSTAYLVSFLFMENTIMTEKIARRGVKTPETYEPDALEHLPVREHLGSKARVVRESLSVKELKELFRDEPVTPEEYIVIRTGLEEILGVVPFANVLAEGYAEDTPMGSLATKKCAKINADENLRSAAEIMAHENVDTLAVIEEDGRVIGVLTYKDILQRYGDRSVDLGRKIKSISLRQLGVDFLLRVRSILVEAGGKPR